MAALYQQVTGKSTVPAGLGIIGAGVVRLSFSLSLTLSSNRIHVCLDLIILVLVCCHALVDRRGVVEALLDPRDLPDRVQRSAEPVRHGAGRVVGAVLPRNPGLVLCRGRRHVGRLLQHGVVPVDGRCDGSLVPRRWTRLGLQDGALLGTSLSLSLSHSATPSFIELFLLTW